MLLRSRRCLVQCQNMVAVRILWRQRLVPMKSLGQTWSTIASRLLRRIAVCQFHRTLSCGPFDSTPLLIWSSSVSSGVPVMSSLNLEHMTTPTWHSWKPVMDPPSLYVFADPHSKPPRPRSGSSGYGSLSNTKDKRDRTVLITDLEPLSSII